MVVMWWFLSIYSLHGLSQKKRTFNSSYLCPPWRRGAKNPHSRLCKVAFLFGKSALQNCNFCFETCLHTFKNIFKTIADVLTKKKLGMCRTTIYISDHVNFCPPPLPHGGHKKLELNVRFFWHRLYIKTITDILKRGWGLGLCLWCCLPCHFVSRIEGLLTQFSLIFRCLVTYLRRNPIELLINLWDHSTVVSYELFS